MEIARRRPVEILSVDSMQVYRGMDIGTAKATAEERAQVTHHMIDVADPEDEFTVAEFRELAHRRIGESNAEVILVVGGSGLHFRSIVDAMSFRPHHPRIRAQVEAEPLDDLVSELEAADPHAGDHIDLSNPRRVRRSVETLRAGGPTPSRLDATPERRRFRAYEAERDFIGFALDLPDIEPTITARLDRMRRHGFLEEVESVAPRMGRTASQAVGYRQLLEVVEGKVDEETGFEEAKRATMRLVKRQRTHFRRDPRLEWLDPTRHAVTDHILRTLQ